MYFFLFYFNSYLNYRLMVRTFCYFYISFNTFFFRYYLELVLLLHTYISIFIQYHHNSLKKSILTSPRRLTSPSLTTSGSAFSMVVSRGDFVQCAAVSVNFSLMREQAHLNIHLPCPALHPTPP